MKVVVAVIVVLLAVGVRHRQRGQHRSPTRAEFLRYDSQPYR